MEMDDFDYLLDSANHAYLEDGGVVIVVGENITVERDMVPYGPKTGVIAYGTFLSAVGIFLDIVIIIAIAKLVKSMQGVNRVLMLMLIAVQISALLFVVPFEVAREYLGYWYLGHIGCRMWTVLSHLCVPAMLWICVAMTFDTICYTKRVPVYSSRKREYKTPCLIIATVVFSAISVAPLVCWVMLEDFVLVEVCAVIVDRVYTPILTALCYFIPALICIVANIALMLTTSRKINYLKTLSSNQLESQTALDPKHKFAAPISKIYRASQDTSAYMNAINNSKWTVLAISTPLIILWSPFYIINLKIPYCDGFCLDPKLWALLQWIGYSYYIIGPCLYFVDKRFVNTLKSWINGTSRIEQETEYSRSITDSDYSARSGYF